MAGNAARLAYLALTLGATGCVSGAHPAVTTTAPPFDPIAFFAGQTHGTGTIKVVLHRPERTVVEGSGRPDGRDSIILDQAVRRGDRPATHRSWRLTRVAPDRYAGTLTDAAGPVSGEVRGNRLHLSFRMRGGLSAQQWLVLDGGGARARNVLLVTRFGLPVARLDELIVREAGSAPAAAPPVKR